MLQTLSAYSLVGRVIRMNMYGGVHVTLVLCYFGLTARLCRQIVGRKKYCSLRGIFKYKVFSLLPI